MIAGRPHLKAIIPPKYPHGRVVHRTVGGTAMRTLQMRPGVFAEPLAAKKEQQIFGHVSAIVHWRGSSPARGSCPTF